MPAADLIGQRFGKLVVQERAGSSPNGQARWRLLCDCGSETYGLTGLLRAGKHQSCSCGRSRPVHGMAHSRLHRIWTGMKGRCQNPQKLAYKDYGGRGIVVCSEWQAFVPFMTWALSNGYEDTLELDRTNNDGPYSPENCRWVTRLVNAQNKRKPPPPGLRYTLAEICRACESAGLDPLPFIKCLPVKRRYR